MTPRPSAPQPDTEALVQRAAHSIFPAKRLAAARALAARLAEAEAQRDGAEGIAEARWRDNEELKRRVATLEAALRDISEYEEPHPQDPSDVYEEFQAIARAALDSVSSQPAQPPAPQGDERE